jgi:hypothetical protein
MNWSMPIRLTIVGLALCGPMQARADLLYVSSYNDSPNAGTIETVTSGGSTSLFASGLGYPYGMAFGPNGNLYVAEVGTNSIEEFTSGGVGSVFATTGLNAPVGLAFDASGYLYVSNAAGTTIEKFTPGGVGSVFASGIPYGYGLALDAAGNLYVAESNNATIEKITPGGVSSAFATGVNGVAALAFDSSGNLYASGDSGVITKITPGGVQSTFASVVSGDYALAFDSAGNLFAANFYYGTITEYNSSGTGSVFLTGLTEPTGLVFAPSTAAAPEPSSLLTMGGWLAMIGAYLRLRGFSRSGSR